MLTSNAIHRDDTLKLIALITMLIDHIGLLLFPDLFVLRLIGRLAFPIFAYYLALGADRTKNPMRYASRLFLFGVISQVPYNWFRGNLLWSFSEPNIFFSLLTGLLIIECLKHRNFSVKCMSLGLFYLVAALDLSYSFYGILLMLGFYLFKENWVGMSIAMVFATLQYYYQTGNPYQAYALPVLLLILWNPKSGIRLPKYFVYGFYPIHLLILTVIYHFWG